MKTTEYAGTPSAPDHLLKGDGALNKAAIGAHGVVDRVASAAEEAARKAAPTLYRAADFAHQAVDNAAAAVAPAAEWLNEQATSLNATQKKFVSSTREYVAANPLTSLGIALAGGFLISRILR